MHLATILFLVIFCKKQGGLYTLKNYLCAFLGQQFLRVQLFLATVYFTK